MIERKSTALRPAKPRINVFGTIPDYIPAPRPIQRILSTELVTGVIVQLPLESVVVSPVTLQPIDVLVLAKAMSHKLGWLAHSPTPVVGSQANEPAKHEPLSGQSTPSMVADELGPKLVAILEPPLEELLSATGVLEWPGTLLPYQVEGVKAFIDRDSLLLADDMGLGKTIQVLAALRILHFRKAIKRALVVAPASLIRQWQREAAKWAPELKVVVVAAPSYQRAALWRLLSHITLVSYETLREDTSAGGTTPATAEGWDVVVLDEASKTKSRESGVSQAAKRVPRKRSWALTGTPFETKLDDVRSILEFVIGTAGRLTVVPIQPEGVREMLGQYQLRRKKTEVLADLPQKTISTVDLELSTGQRSAYDQAESEGVVQLRERGAKVRVSHVLELILRLKQICNMDPATGESAKLDDIIERVDTLVDEGHRALLFTQFTDDTFGSAMVANRLARFSPIEYTGNLSQSQKLIAEDTFRTNSEHKIMILSLRAGGMGLNLQSASYVFHLDRWWNPAIEDQAESRSHRMGQQLPVNVYRYVCGGTIEERIESILAERRALFADIVDDANLDLATVLSKRELFGLFGLEPSAGQGAVSTEFGAMDGVEFERWLADNLRQAGFVVDTTQASRDGGVDLVATRTDIVGIQSRLIIQCKNHSNPLGVGPIRELRGVVNQRDAGVSPVVACPSGFSGDAVAFARANGVVLWGGKELRQLVDLLG